jgi:hypothetical protein
MQHILSLLPVLACPVGMGLIMWLMMRGNKQQTPREIDQTRVPIDNQPPAVAELPTMEVPSRRTSTFNLLGMCLNWKVLTGLAVVALLVLIVAPQFFWAALPILLVAACPLSMLFMMRGMSGSENATGSRPAQIQRDQLPAGLTRDEDLAQLQSRMSSLQAEQEAIARQIAGMESPEAPVSSGAEAVAREDPERNRKRTAHL